MTLSGKQKSQSGLSVITFKVYAPEIYLAKIQYTHHINSLYKYNSK